MKTSLVASIHSQTKSQKQAPIFFSSLPPPVILLHTVAATTVSHLHPPFAVPPPLPGKPAATSHHVSPCFAAMFCYVNFCVLVATFRGCPAIFHLPWPPTTITNATTMPPPSDLHALAPPAGQDSLSSALNQPPKFLCSSMEEVRNPHLILYCF